jgi:general stress protein 26
MSDDARTLDEIMENGPITMLVTADQKARPMTVLEHHGARLSFLTDRSTEWMDEMTDNEQVAVVISDPGDSIFVSLTGTAWVSDDRETLDELWSPALEAWFDGREDPNLIALHVDVHDGEYWDGPGTGAGRALRGLAGIVTGEGRKTMGEQGDVVT